MRTFIIIITLVFLSWLEGFIEGVTKFNYEIPNIPTMAYIMLTLGMAMAVAQDINELFNKHK